jgi:hypothetical protein
MFFKFVIFNDAMQYLIMHDDLNKSHEILFSSHGSNYKEERMIFLVNVPIPSITKVTIAIQFFRANTFIQVTKYCGGYI